MSSRTSCFPVLLMLQEVYFFMLTVRFRADDLLGYGKPNSENKWWFDLEDADGVL